MGISSLISFLFAFMATFTSSCKDTAAARITQSLVCYKTPLALSCDNIQVRRRTIHRELFSRFSDKRLLKERNFTQKYDVVSYDIAPKGYRCKDAIFDMNKSPRRGDLYYMPDGKYKVCIKYINRSDRIGYAESETVLLTSN